MMFLRINLEYVDTSKVLKHVLVNIIFSLICNTETYFHSESSERVVENSYQVWVNTSLSALHL